MIRKLFLSILIKYLLYLVIFTFNSLSQIDTSQINKDNNTPLIIQQLPMNEGLDISLSDIENSIQSHNSGWVSKYLDSTVYISNHLFTQDQVKMKIDSLFDYTTLDTTGIFSLSNTKTKGFYSYFDIKIQSITADTNNYSGINRGNAIISIRSNIQSDPLLDTITFKILPTKCIIEKSNSLINAISSYASEYPLSWYIDKGSIPLILWQTNSWDYIRNIPKTPCIQLLNDNLDIVDNLFIPTDIIIVVNGQTYIFPSINRSITKLLINRNLFGSMSFVDAVFGGSAILQSNPLISVADNGWRRITTANLENFSITSIPQDPDNPSYAFGIISSISINPNSMKHLICDLERNKLIELELNPSTNTLSVSWESPIASTLMKPAKAFYIDNGDKYNYSEQICVVDHLRNNLKIYSKSNFDWNNPLYTISRFEGKCGIEYFDQISDAAGIPMGQDRKYYRKCYVVDKDGKRMIMFDLGSRQGDLVKSNNVIFNQFFRTEIVAEDGNSETWFAGKGSGISNLFHKFDDYGNYIGSVKLPQSENNGSLIWAGAPYKIAINDPSINGIYRWPSYCLYTASNWTETSGFKKYFLGSAVSKIDVDYVQYNNQAWGVNVKTHLLSMSKIRIVVNGNLVLEEYSSGRIYWFYMLPDPNINPNTFCFSVLPGGNDYYGSNAQPWKTYCVNIDPNPPLNSPKVIPSMQVKIDYVLKINVYPNPCNPMSIINVDLPDDNQTTNLDIIDIHGRKVQELMNGKYSSGRYSHVFNGMSLSSGLYIVRLAHGSIIKNTKLVVVK